MDTKQAASVLLIIAKHYTNFSVDQRSGKEWIDFLMLNVDQEEAMRNLYDHVKTKPFPPTLHDICKPNVRLRAEREKQRTREYLDEMDARMKAKSPPPWVVEGITRMEYLDRVKKGMGIGGDKQPGS